MRKKNLNTAILEMVVSPILVTGNAKIRPFVELFEYQPENILMQPLGNILGFFQIRSFRDDSAYIVNFLNSVIKKEYYINHRRTVPESLDATLHKINLALTEIVKDGNIEWLGKLDAAVCVIDRNTCHFSVAGNAKILLLRNQTILEISEGLAPESPEPNPLKTFENVSSGDLEPGDKIIITSDNIFEVFSLTEIKRGAARFTSEKFVQFIRTALTNELSMSATIVIDVKDKQAVEPEKKKQKKGIDSQTSFNAFSEKTFHEYSQRKDGSASSTKPEETTPLREKEYEDKKTGHIYIQGEYSNQNEDGKFEKHLGNVKEKISDLLYILKNKLNPSDLVRSTFKKSKKYSREVIEKIRIKRAAQTPAKSNTPKIIKIPATSISTAKNIASTTALAIFSFVKKVFLLSADLADRLPKQKIKNFLRMILPNFSKIKSAFYALSYQQKVIAIGLVALVVLAPLPFVKKSPPPKTNPETQVIPEKSEAEIMLEDKSTKEITTVTTLLDSQFPKKISILQDNVFIATEKELIQLGDASGTKFFQIPAENAKIVDINPLEDLNMLLLFLENGSLYSFSPLPQKFQENKISIPNIGSTKSIGTYMTYLYLTDEKDNQILRYPRVTGGFGNHSNWLKSGSSISNISDMSIDENIYTLSGGKVTKFFRGEPQNFNLEDSFIPRDIVKIFTSRDTSRFYALDKNNGRIIAFSKTGSLESQYYNIELKEANDFSVNEKNSTVYFITDQALKSFNF